MIARSGTITQRFVETIRLLAGLGAPTNAGGRTGDGWEARALLDSGELIFNENLHTNKALGDGARACNQLRALLILINISGRPPTVAILIN